jgi:acyl-CoA thioesterase-1
MRRSWVWPLVISSLFLAAGVTGLSAEKGKPAPSRKKAVDPAFAPVRDDPALPRVLLIGDSISIGYTPAVREALAGKANVHRPATNCGPTIRGLAELDKWLGDGKWDVIHFNWGLHDLRMDNGVSHQVPIKQYEKNLSELVGRLKKTGARLVWCSTSNSRRSKSPVKTGGVVAPFS